ncbi:GNAT family N-acetyltransferase [Ralstonia syzygii]|uniref:GNAT family N-acetyltransferase n=1 Tax=Ralstonia syzygii TaxID=28097 RepID=UPI003510C6C2
MDGRPVGYADLQPSGYIDQFFVCGAHARQGVGQALMHHLFGQAEARDIRALSVLVSRNVEPFFLRNGFTVAARQQVAVHGVILPNAWMTRTLP